MRAIENETSVEVLREFGKLCVDHIARLEKELAEAREAKAKKEQLSLSLEDQLTVLRKRLFGKSSEKRPHASDRAQKGAEDKMLLASQSLLPPLKENQTKKLDEDVEYYDLSAEELAEESRQRGIENPSAAQWEEIKGLYDESVEVTVIERVYKKKRQRRKKYHLKKEFNTSDKEVIVTANGPEKLLPGATYSIDIATSVVSDKYVAHIPLERQTRQMESLGLKNMNTKTLYNLSNVVGVYLEPIASMIMEEVIKSGLIIHADESPWPIQIKEQDNGYMWTISNQIGAYYFFEPTRSGKVIKKVLSGYTGKIVCDGYTGYNRLISVGEWELCNCWSHVRRKFTDIEKDYPTETKEILDLIDELFAVEHEARNYPQLKMLRESKSRPLTEKIEATLMKALEEVRAESSLRAAIKYALNHWSGLTIFLKDERVPLSNNEAERMMRHAVMGRKNFYGSRNHNGADLAATMYTIIQSCKKHQLDPRTYIDMIIRLTIKGEAVMTPFEYARQLHEREQTAAVAIIQ
jgi:transposase